MRLPALLVLLVTASPALAGPYSIRPVGQPTLAEPIQAATPVEAFRQFKEAAGLAVNPRHLVVSRRCRAACTQYLITDLGSGDTFYAHNMDEPELPFGCE